MEQGDELNHAQIKVEALCNVKDEEEEENRNDAEPPRESRIIKKESHQKSMDEKQNSLHSACLGLSSENKSYEKPS